MSIDVLWYSVPPFKKTGYGVQTKGIINELTKYEDINIDVNTFNKHLENDKKIKVNGKKVQLFSGDGNYFNNDLIERSKDYDVVVTHMDQWLIPQEWKKVNSDLIHWSIIDQSPPPKALDIIDKQDNTRAIVPMTGWAKRQMLKYYNSLKTVEPIYHGIDVSKFESKEENIDKKYKDFVDNTDFFVGMISTNCLRELIPNNLEAFAMFAESVEITPRIYINSELNRADGYYMPTLVEHLTNKYDIDRSQITFRDPRKESISDDELSFLYKNMDVLLATSTGDSFGIPLIEAGACRTPSIVNDFSAPSELIGENRGLKIKPSADIWLQKTVSKQKIPKTEDIADALIKYFNEPELKNEHGENMYKWVKKNCNWDKIGKEWVNLLREKYD